jgi:hypothetical protein
MNNKRLAVVFFISIFLTSFSKHPTSIPFSIPMMLKESAPDFYSQLRDQDLNFNAFEYGLKGFLKLQEEGKIENSRFLTIIDMSVSANENRFFVIDIDDKKIVHKSKVAHGRNSGQEFATNFSNQMSSYQTSLGFYKTGELYQGKHGLSLRLDGLEDANSNARARAVVIHAADYVSEMFIKKNGRLGRSLGCPALPAEGYQEIIGKIKEGSLLFIYHPTKSYLNSSKLIKSGIDAMTRDRLPV